MAIIPPARNKSARGVLASLCLCPICRARKKTVIGRKGKKEKVTIIFKEKEVTNEEDLVKKVIANKVCSTCYQVTGVGIDHPCSANALKKNLTNLICNSEGPGKEQISMAIMKKVIREKGIERGEEMRCKQLKGGNDLVITVGKPKIVENLVTAQTIGSVKKVLDLSKRDTGKLCAELKKAKVKLESNIRTTLDGLGKTLEDVYENVKINFEESKEADSSASLKESKKKVKKKKLEVTMKVKDVTIVKDVKELIKKVIIARDLDKDDVMVRVAIDGGGGSLKVVVNIFEAKSDPEVTFSKSEKPGQLNSGFNKLIILAYVENLQERYLNLRKLMEHLSLAEVPGIFIVGDCKILNCLLGISHNSGKFSCIYCEGPKSLSSGILRTFGRLADSYQAFAASGSGI